MVVLPPVTRIPTMRRSCFTARKAPLRLESVGVQWLLLSPNPTLNGIVGGARTRTIFKLTNRWRIDIFASFSEAFFGLKNASNWSGTCTKRLRWTLRYWSYHKQVRFGRYAVFGVVCFLLLYWDMYSGNSVAPAEKQHFTEYFIRIINQNTRNQMPVASYIQLVASHLPWLDLKHWSQHVWHIPSYFSSLSTSSTPYRPQLFPPPFSPYCVIDLLYICKEIVRFKACVFHTLDSLLLLCTRDPRSDVSA